MQGFWAAATSSLVYVPLVLSVISIIVSYRTATRSHRSGLRPFLIFYNREFDPNEENDLDHREFR